jgi:hypothetical protein
MFHHVYEWGAVGDQSARLFALSSMSRGSDTFAITYDFKRSSVPVPGSEPHVFFNKAEVMESRQQVVIEPVNGSLLSFEYDGRQVFTAGPVVVDNPGGDGVNGSFKSAFMLFFRPSVIKNNPAYRSVIDSERRKVMDEIRRAR